MIKKDIIKDQKETIHRLQEECKEKTDIIEEMNEVLQNCNIQRVRLYKALEKIKKICSEYPHIDDKGDYQVITGDTPVVKELKEIL